MGYVCIELHREPGDREAPHHAVRNPRPAAQEEQREGDEYGGEDNGNEHACRQEGLAGVVDDGHTQRTEGQQVVQVLQASSF